MIRFNTDSGHLEYYTGTHWVDVITNNNELGDQNNSNSSGGTGIVEYLLVDLIHHH